jgi:hypothetical protein
VVFDDHRRGNWTPYLFRTDDLFGFVHVIEEDPLEPNLLFLGTEFGLYVSLDAGESWMRWSHGIPAAPVRGLMVHPRDHDLTIGTHGRAVYILDDVRPLRELAGDGALAETGVHLFQPAPAIQYLVAERIGYRSTGHAMFFGEMRPYGALLNYWVADGDESEGLEVEIKIADGAGEHIRTLTGPVVTGLNRVVWDLRLGDPPGADGGFFRPRGGYTLPGVYRVTVRLGELESTGEVQVLADPRTRIPADRRRAKLAALEEAGAWMAVGAQAQQRLEDAAEAVDGVLESLPSGEEGAELREAGQELKSVLRGALESLFTGPECQGICGRNVPISTVREPLGRLGSSMDAPSVTDRLAMVQAEAALRGILDEVNRIFSQEVAAYRQILLDAGFTPFPEQEPLRAGSGR